MGFFCVLIFGDSSMDLMEQLQGCFLSVPILAALCCLKLASRGDGCIFYCLNSDQTQQNESELRRN